MRRAIVLALVVGGLAATAAVAQPHATAVVKVAKTRLGSILVDGRGRTLYLFTADANGSISCTASYSNCTATWPPFLTSGKPRAGAGVSAGLLGMVRRTGPSGLQVTYKGHPLYFYVGDKKTGDVRGQGFLGLWYVVSPRGVAIKKK